MELRPAKVRLDIVAHDLDRCLQLAGFDLGGDFAQQPAELALEVAHPGFAGVVRDDSAQRLVIHAHFVGSQPIALQLSLQQMIARDGQLFFFRISVQPDDLHPVEQRPGDGVRHVRRRDEQDF